MYLTVDNLEPLVYISHFLDKLGACKDMECWHWIAKDCLENIIFHLAPKLFEPDPRSLCLLQDWASKSHVCSKYSPLPQQRLQYRLRPAPSAALKPTRSFRPILPLWTSQRKNVTNEILSEVLWVVSEEENRWGAALGGSASLWDRLQSHAQVTYALRTQ